MSQPHARSFAGSHRNSKRMFYVRLRPFDYCISGEGVHKVSKFSILCRLPSISSVVYSMLARQDAGGSQASQGEGIHPIIIAGGCTEWLPFSHRSLAPEHACAALLPMVHQVRWIGPRQRPRRRLLLICMLIMLILILIQNTSRKPCFTARGTTFYERIYVWMLKSEVKIALRLQSVTPPTSYHHHVGHRPQTL